MVNYYFKFLWNEDKSETNEKTLQWSIGCVNIAIADLTVLVRLKKNIKEI